VETSHGFLLLDTGASNARDQLERELVSAGCKPGNLDLIVLTHGDFDHTGNAAYLRDKFSAKIAMHRDDSGMAEHADMFWNRSSGNAIIRFLAPVLFRFAKANRFKPDFTVDEGYNFSEYGFEAQVISIPGHSKGSIGILTAEGDLFCGDLLENSDEPATNSIMDNPAACDASIAKLEGLKIDTVYPGHGNPFSMELFTSSRQKNSQE
jgi:glyoxylase-like metal-dependent hydrolase (beta-lactamase superfamily II)